jgi:acetyltransferase-like isoleucine patch superfamily enzyme
VPLVGGTTRLTCEYYDGVEPRFRDCASPWPHGPHGSLRLKMNIPISRFAVRALDAVLQRTSSEIGRIRLILAGVEFAPTARCLGIPIVQRFEDSRIIVEENVVLCSSSRWTALGVSHPVVLRTLRPGAILRIGRNTGISGGSICSAVSVHIGMNCLIGADVLIADTDFHPISGINRRHDSNWDEIRSAEIHIGDNVFVGSRVTILKGVRVGDGAVIGAGAVVTRAVPSDSIVAGNPARVLGSIHDQRNLQSEPPY